MRRHDLSQRTFGQWQPIKVVSDVGGYLKWLCRCTCGREAVVSSSNLRSGNSTRCKACASLRTAAALRQHSPERAALLRIIRDYKARAARKALAFAIEEPDFQQLVTARCHYCGSPPANASQPRGRHTTAVFHYNGIDRVDNAVGYVVGNVVSCCRACNSAKADMTTEEFEAWIARLIEHRAQRKAA